MGISLLNLPVLLECGVGAVKDPCKQITFVGKNIISFVFSPKSCKIKKIDKKKVALVHLWYVADVSSVLMMEGLS